MCKIKFWFEHEEPRVDSFETLEDFKRVKQYYEANSESIICIRIYYRKYDGRILFTEDEIKKKLGEIERCLCNNLVTQVSLSLSALNIKHDIEYYESEIAVKIYSTIEVGLITKYFFNIPRNKADADVILGTVIERVLSSYQVYRREIAEKLINILKGAKTC